MVASRAAFSGLGRVGRVDHPQRTKDSRLVPVLERLAGQLLEEVAENGGGRRVVPFRPGIEQQRQHLRIVAGLRLNGEDRGARERIAQTRTCESAAGGWSSRSAPAASCRSRRFSLNVAITSRPLYAGR